MKTLSKYPYCPWAIECMDPHIKWGLQILMSIHASEKLVKRWGL